MPSVQDLEELLSLKNENEIIIKLDDAVSGLCGYGEKLDNLTEPQRIFFFNQSFEKEVNNGGFSQYFLNSSGDYARQTVESLNLIGAHRTAKILQEAINEFPNGRVPEDRGERLKILEDIENESAQIWEKLEEQFYKYEDNLNLLNLCYVRENKADF